MLGCGLIQFKRIEDASKAIFNTNKNEFLGRPISCTWAVSKEKFLEEPERKFKAQTQKNRKVDKETINLDGTQDESVKKKEKPNIWNCVWKAKRPNEKEKMRELL